MSDKALTTAEETSAVVVHQELDDAAKARLRSLVASQGINWAELSKDAGVVNLDLYGVGEPFDKDELVNTEFVVIDWRDMPGTFGSYAFVECVTRDNRHGFFTDGGVGILDFLRTVHMATGRKSGLHAPRGLRRSDYRTEIDGKPVDATTYYFA